MSRSCFAAVILEQALERLDVWAVRATRRGLRDGVLVELRPRRAITNCFALPR